MRCSPSLLRSFLALSLVLTTAAEAGSRAQITVLDPTPGATLVRIVPGSLEQRAVSIGGAGWLELSIPGEGYTEELGAPRLPRVSRSVIVPDADDVEVFVSMARWHEIAGVDVAPARGPIPRTQDPASVPYGFGPAYQQDAFYPAELGDTGRPYILRDRRGVVLEANVLQYNPVRRVLRVCDELVLLVRSTGPSSTNVLDRTGAPDRSDSSFEQLYQQHFVNAQTSQLVPFNSNGRMLVIAPASYLAELQPLVDWKRSIGIHTTLVDLATIGTTSTAVKTFIQGVYGSTNLSFVLLVGDIAQMPSFSFSGGAADPLYSLMTADNYPDLIVGRFSAETTAQVRTQVQRTISYEQADHSQASGGWNAKATGIASDQGPGHFGEYDYQHMNNIRNDELALGISTVDQIYDPTATKAQITSALNNGRRLLNYCGHGSDTSWGTTGFSNTEVNALANEGHLPFIQSVACVNGNFSNGTCFAEAWLRATHNSQPSGAVGAYMSSINQYWDEPMYSQDQATDLFVAQQQWAVGALWYAGSCYMMDVLPGSGPDMFKTWHTFGDPSLRILGSVPAATNAYCAAKTTSIGTLPTIDCVGTPSVSAGNFVLTCRLGVPTKTGLHFSGPGQQSLPWLGGTLCVLPPLARGPAFTFDAYGTIAEPIAFSAADVGRQIYFQYYGRDPQALDGTGVMLSNALRVDVLP